MPLTLPTFMMQTSSELSPETGLKGESLQKQLGASQSLVLMCSFHVDVCTGPSVNLHVESGAVGGRLPQWTFHLII